MIHFEGPIVPWYQMLQKSEILTSWASLVRALEQAYWPSMYESLDYELFTLFQEDYVSNYYVTFTVLANIVEGMSPSDLLPRFISGLKKDIQRDVIPWRPKFITTTVALAKLYEEKYITESKTMNKRQSYNPDLSSITNPNKKVIVLANPYRAANVLPIIETSNVQQALPSIRNHNL